ncbi:MAG TPA: hypothetical protein VMK32_03425 [Burkholderiaceae bacterium]|nr:hypothetical protein [Burkholderiaceae bacterium]
MKRDHFHIEPLRRPARITSAVLAAVLSGVIGASIGWGYDEGASPSLRGEPTLLKRVSAPDSALLSESDVERALPVPVRTMGMTGSAMS